MAMEHTPQGRGRRFHRGRRGPDRRGSDAREPQGQGQGGRDKRSSVDVEQLMRDIRSRVSQRQGIELTPQQIEDLAARRLESILDLRSVRSDLLDQLRQASGIRLETPAATVPEPSYAFDSTTLYDSPGGLVRFIRRALNPLLRLFFNPDPLVAALNAQAKLNEEAAARDAAREQQQAEWNALHYEIVRRVVSEVSRLSIEAQSLTLRVESLAAKVDFNERRVRSIEGTTYQATSQVRTTRGSEQPDEAPRQEAEPDAVSGDGTRRRRRRRRGRRGTPVGEAVPPDEVAAPDEVATPDEATSPGEAASPGEIEPSGETAPSGAEGAEPAVHTNTVAIEATVSSSTEPTAEVEREIPPAGEKIAPPPAHVQETIDTPPVEVAPVQPVDGPWALEPQPDPPDPGPTDR